MAWLFWVLIHGNALGVLAMGRKRSVARGTLALALGLMSVIAPAFGPHGWPVFRTVVAFGAMAGYFRLIAIVRHPDSSLGARFVAILLPVIDPRRLPPAPRVVHARVLVRGVFDSACAVALFLVARRVPEAAPYAGWHSALRTFVGGASAYFMVEGAARLAESIFAAAGVDLGKLHDQPILSRTVAEFWGRRWNRSIHAWLSDNAFRPAARRAGVSAGVLATFAASAVLHFVPIATAYDFTYASSMGAFFLVHGVIVVVESKLGVARWPRAVGHVWTLGWFAITAPLFVEPLLRALEN